MRNFTKLLVVAVFLMMGSTALAAPTDVSVATMNISGDVPAVFNVTARGYPGDLDLSPGVQVHDRLIGILHFKYNIPVATLTMASSTNSGRPTLGGAAAAGAYAWGAAGFYFKADAGCTAVDPAKLDGATDLTAVGLDVAGAVANLVEEDCPITASWEGSTGMQPAGSYSMTITVTMTST